MKHSLMLVLLLTTSAAWAAAPMRVGAEIDYVSTAFADWKSVSWDVRGDDFSATERGLVGALVKEAKSADWVGSAKRGFERLREILTKDGWEVGPQAGSKEPSQSYIAQIMVDAKKGSEEYHFLITIFPEREGVVDMVFFQLRK